jgi:hypothetical protein
LADFRHALHELYMYLVPLRNLYQAYWERLSQDSYPHHLLMADPEYGRVVMANFFWDYSVQFSDARAILRAARDTEGKNVRMANDFRQWGLAPLWLYFVVEGERRHGYVRMVGGRKAHRVEHGGELPPPGTVFAARLLAYRGKEFLHPALLGLPREASEAAVQGKLEGVCRALGVKSGAGLRPDVQCEEWRRHGALFLALWRELVYDAVVGVPARTVTVAPAFALPAGDASAAARQLEAGGAVALGKGRYELRHRVLPLARLELREDAILVSLLDPAFRSYVLRWLADHLGAVEPGQSGSDASSPDAAPGGSDAWIHTPLAALNGQTPIQASTHDFGRRKLEYLLRSLIQKGRDVSVLRRQLGL